VRDLETRLRGHGKNVELFVHPGVEHAFFNDTRSEVYHRETADKTWGKTVAFFREHVK
jgi:carboxymethylenebutenolidase